MSPTGIEAWTSGPQLLVGQSLGGLTAAAVAASRPDLVARTRHHRHHPRRRPERRPDPDPRVLRGPDRLGVARRDWSTARWPSGSAASRRAAERGVFLNSRMRPDGRFEWKHHFAHLAAAMAASPELAAAAAAQQDGVAACPLAERLGRPRGGHRAGHAHPRRPRLRHRGERRRVPASACPRHPSTSLRSGHNVQEELPVDLGARLRALAGKGLTLVLRSVYAGAWRTIGVL